MRAKLPLLRKRYIPPARAPVLRYGVAVLSIILALIPAFLLSDVVESRLVVFAVAIMVSAWYGGWKPGLVATSFALTVSAYFSLAGARTPCRLSPRHHTSGAVCVRRRTDLLLQRRAALGPGRTAPLRDQLSLAGHPCSLRGLPLRLRPAFCWTSIPRWSPCWATTSARELVGQQSGQPVFRFAAVVRPGRLPAHAAKISRPGRRLGAQGPHHHQRAPLRTRLPRRTATPSSSNCSPRTSPNAAPWSSNSARPRRWKPWAGSPAASPTTSTTC